MRPTINLIGHRFDKLFVIEVSERKYGNNETLWICQCQCGNTIEVPGNFLRNKIRKSCGCMWKPLNEEYLSELKLKLEKNSKWNGQCQEWTGQKNRKGYGRIHITDKTMDNVHKISWMIHISRIPKGFQVIHKCGNILCFRPEHLELLKKE
jgi:hypothetical protein